MAEAILAGDVRKLGELIAGADAEKIRIDPRRFPFELPRRTRGPESLRGVAAAAGMASLRYLLEFFGLRPRIETLLGRHQGDVGSTSPGRSGGASRRARDDGRGLPPHRRERDLANHLVGMSQEWFG
jgi:hypothetical protein